MASRESDGQRRLRTGPWLTRPFVYLAVLSSLALVYEVLKANEVSWAGQVHLLGVAPTTAFLIGTVGWLVTRDKDARAMRPILRSVSGWAVGEPEGGRSRYVRLTNNGPGIAIIKRVHWVVESRSVALTVVTDRIVELRARLGEWGYSEGPDYSLANYSPGTSIRPQEERGYFTASKRVVDDLRCFDVVFEFESLMGDVWERRISLLPHEGASATTSWRQSADGA